MKKLNIFLIHHDPHPKVFRDDVGNVGFDVNVLVAKSVLDAKDWLGIAVGFDAVFVCYEMRGGENNIDACVIRECRAAGFGAVVNGKPLVAFSRDTEENQKLLMAGCNYICHPDQVSEFFLQEFGG